MEEIKEGYKKTKIGIVPSEWEQFKIKQIMQKIRNSVNVEKKTIYKEIGIRSHGKGIFHKEEIEGEKLGNKSVFWIEPNCFILNIVFAWEQAVAKTTDKEIGMIASHRFPMYKVNDKKANLNYILYFFKTKRGKELLELASPGGAGRNKTLGQKEFEELELFLPHIKEQIKIAEILSLWDETINKQIELIKQKKLYKKGLMQKLLSGEMRFKEFKEEWREVKIKNVTKIESGGTPLTTEQSYWSGNIFWCIPTDITKNKNKYILKTEKTITIKGLKKSSAKLLPINSILMCSRATIGERCINKIEMATNQGFKSFICDENKLYYEYMYYLIEILKKVFISKSSGTTFLEISKKDIENIKISLPPLKEQTKIANTLSAVDREIELLEAKLKQYKLQKKGLMQKLLSGEVRVKIN